jgi:hypothetical protein
MKPDVTTRNDSLLYRVYSLFYWGSPNDTCEYRKRLLSIVLLQVPFFVFAIALALLALFMMGMALASCTQALDVKELGFTALITLAFLGAIVVTILIIVGIGKLCKKFALLKGILTGLGVGLLITLLVGSMILFVTGQSVFSLGMAECGQLSLYISIFGALVWVFVAIMMIVCGCAEIFDSETYRTLKASAKERWCAKVTVVDKDGNAVVMKD